MKEALELIHPIFGVLSVIAAVWVIVETLNISSANLRRINIAAFAVAALMGLAWLTSGYLYVFYYAADKAIILKGPWPFAHSFFMEFKEHLFYATLILSFFLPVAARVKDLLTNREAQRLVMWVAALIVLTTLALEGAGAIISMGVRMGLSVTGVTL